MESLIDKLSMATIFYGFIGFPILMMIAVFYMDYEPKEKSSEC